MEFGGLDDTWLGLPGLAYLAWLTWLGLPGLAYLAWLICLGSPAVSVQAPRQNPLLRVQPVLGLVEHHRLRPVDHLVGDLLAAMGRQAVHEDGVGLGARHQPRIDLIALEQVMAPRAVAVAHGDPGIGDDAVGALDGFLRVRTDVDLGAG